MDPIAQINEERIRPFIGLPVYVVTKEGSHYYGILSRVNGGKIILNDDAKPATATLPKTAKKKKKAGKGRSPSEVAQAAHENDFGKPLFAPAFNQRFVLEMSRISLLLPQL